MNLNQGAIIAVLTGVYVVATIITTCMIYRSNCLTRESIKIGRESMQQDMQFERERNRPYIIFDWDLDRDWLCAILKNIGKTPALNVKVLVDESMKCIGGGPPSFIDKTIPFMAPGHELKDIIDIVYDFFKNNTTPSYRVTIEYENMEGQSFKETILIDLECLRGLRRSTPTDYAKKIAEELRTIGEYLSGLRKLTSKMTSRGEGKTEEDKNKDL